MRSSRAAVDLIVAHEISSRATYEKRYQRPEWPGVASGITVGIGYDLGYNTPSDILNDWKDYLTPDVIREMQRYAGIRGSAAQQVLAQSRKNILVPWDPAMAVFMKTSMPKFEAMVLRACPGADQLPPGCFGVLTSLAYNRGASFSKSGERYAEMRNIRTHVASGDWNLVPEEIRSMKRLWDKRKTPGLHRRRDEEAALWVKSLATAKSKPNGSVPLPPTREDTGDERAPWIEDVSARDPVTPAGNDTPPNVQPSHIEYSIETELIQRALIDLKYFEVGDPDGKAGGKFVAGVAAFMTDRGKDPNKGEITPELKLELSRAKVEKLPSGEPWSRPIAPARANATAKDIAPKVESVNQTWYTKLWAYVLGIPSAAVALFKSLFGDYNDPSSYIYSVKSFFGAIPVEYYAFVAAGVAGLILYQATKAQNATVKGYNEGKIN